MTEAELTVDDHVTTVLARSTGSYATRVTVRPPVLEEDVEYSQSPVESVLVVGCSSRSSETDTDFPSRGGFTVLEKPSEVLSNTFNPLELWENGLLLNLLVGAGVSWGGSVTVQFTGSAALGPSTVLEKLMIRLELTLYEPFPARVLVVAVPRPLRV